MDGHLKCQTENPLIVSGREYSLLALGYTAKFLKKTKKLKQTFSLCVLPLVARNSGARHTALNLS